MLVSFRLRHARQNQVVVGGVDDIFYFFCIGGFDVKLVFFFSLLLRFDNLLALLLPEEQVLFKQLAQLLTSISQ